VLVTLLYEMIRRDSKTGLASLCLGGGEAVAMIVKRPGAPLFTLAEFP
jgi:acetyl-CoA C-acetyltransferase